MKLTNNEIYSYAQQLSALNIGDIKMPVRINFFLQKNMQVIAAAGQEIDAARTALVAQFGELNNEGTMYIVPPEKMVEAQKELNDLFALEQELNIHVFNIDDFDGIELTVQQLSALMFMIEE